MAAEAPSLQLDAPSTAAERNMAIINLMTMDKVDGKSGKNWAATACEWSHNHQFGSPLDITAAQHHQTLWKCLLIEMERGGMFCGASAGKSEENRTDKVREWPHGHQLGLETPPMTPNAENGRRDYYYVTGTN